MLLAEANQWPEDAVAYFGDGDECHMAFHFPLMPRLFMALRMEDRFPIIDILEQTPAIPENCQWAHVPAQPRRADAGDGHRRGARLHVPRLRHDPAGPDQPRHPPPAGAAARQRPRDRADERPALLAARHAGLYYGDEIGMGDNIYLGDRNGVRTPMQWSADRNAGFSRANPQKLYLPVIIDPEYHYERSTSRRSRTTPLAAVVDEAADRLRKQPQGLRPRHARVPAPGQPQGAGLRPPYEDETILVVANLSRFVQKFGAALLQAIAKRQSIDGQEGEIRGMTTRATKGSPIRTALDASVLRAEQSNTAILYGDAYFLKLFRRLEGGVSTDYEISRFLTEQTDFPNTPRLLGALEYHRPKSEPSTLAILQEQVPNAGDAWNFTLGALGRYFETVASRKVEQVGAAQPAGRLVETALAAVPPAIAELLGTYVPAAELLGRRVAEMHLALASKPEVPAFRPEPFTPHYQRSIYQHMRTQAAQAVQLLRKSSRNLPENVRNEVDAVLAAEPEIQNRFRAVLERKITGLRIRCHGDLHLGQVLYTGKDFYIIDFEGEPSRPLSERRIKRSPLRDVAGMIRSFHYAGYAVLMGQAEGVSIRREDAQVLELGARIWYLWAGAIFLRSYLDTAAAGKFLPATSEELQVLLDAYLLEKALYETVYELNSRPDWVRIPIRGILDLLGGAK
jgi:trehalose synthase-fused probable maltokinase